ncbi:hypothetical protein [Paenibacillus ihbetae]|uniref:hypothetical protein n=1 Tax=Paenibacillus ihbetae TaxID=1870820 RepID=UPI0013001369|nr:hypothetical protein [Paenibacillus ihbetae]
MTQRLTVDEKKKLYYDYYDPETIENNISDLQLVNADLTKRLEATSLRVPMTSQQSLPWRIPWGHYSWKLLS